jgi:hypothetical protein
MKSQQRDLSRSNNTGGCINECRCATEMEIEGNGKNGMRYGSDYSMVREIRAE